MHPSEHMSLRAEPRALPPYPHGGDAVAEEIHADQRLVQELQRVHRFSEVEAADYLRFCRENLAGEGQGHG